MPSSTVKLHSQEQLYSHCDENASVDQVSKSEAHNLKIVHIPSYHCKDLKIFQEPGSIMNKEGTCSNM